MATTLNMNDVISLAKKNQKEASNKTKIGFSTSLQGPTKLGRNVNPAAVKAFLERQRKQNETKAVEDAKKKESLQKLREEVKHTKKAKAMASRTKDNLQVYRGEDYLGLHKAPKTTRNEEFPLSPEADRQHKAFMKKINKMPYKNRDGSRETHGYHSSDEDNRKRKKIAKNRIKARSAAAGLNFDSLLKLAEKKQKETVSTDEDSDDTVSSDSDDSEDGLTAQEKYEREKRKRKELEARLKNGTKGVKRKSGDSASHSLKIGKLQSGLSDESKKMKIQAIMAKFGQKHPGKASSSNSQQSRAKTKSASPSLKDSRHSSPLNGRPRSNQVSKSNNSNKLHEKGKTKSDSAYALKNGHSSKSTKQMETKLSKSTSKQSAPAKGRSNPYLEAMKKAQAANAQKKSVTYTEMMAKAQSNMAKSSGQCKLSVQSHGVRTNYPGVAETDPKNASYQKPKKRPPGLPNGSRMTPAEEYRRRAMAANMHPRDVAAVYRRAQVLHDDDDEDDEYDSELEGFIEDGEDDYDDDDVSAQIGAIFGYNRHKYGRESEYDLSKMDASYKDIEKEEKRSLRIAQIEDAQEAKLEEQRLKRSKEKRR